MARATMMRILTTLVATTMLVQLALAVDHSVGGSNGGWDTTTNLQSWASSQTFSVGDKIVFSFTPNHNVLEVSKDDYDSCSTSNPTTTNGLTPVTISLTAAGSRYFICGTPGHCDQGMKVEVKTVAAASTPPTTTTPPSPTPPISTTPPSSDDTPSPPVSTTSPSSDDTPSPPISTVPTAKPSSAETVKMTAVSMMGFGFLMMI